MKNTENAHQLIRDTIARFQNGDIAPIVEIAALHLTTRNENPMSSWSWLNQVIAYAGTKSYDCRTYKQWQTAGRQVKKGEHATYILAPMTIKDPTPERPDNIRLIGFKTLPVFADWQTDGEPLPVDAILNPPTIPPLADVAKAWNIPVEYVPLHADWLGCYNHGAKSITLCTHAEQVFFHELAHAAHHRIEKLKGGQDPRQETIAEFTSCILMALCGLQDTTGHAWHYIQHYAPEDPLKAISAALDTIEQVIDLILSTANTQNKE